MSATGWIAFVAAGAGGASARFLVDRAIRDRLGHRFPWGTLVVNLTGSFLLGLITGLALHHGLPRTPRLVLGTGFCGAYTTFSTYTFETVTLLADGAPAAALRNTALTVVGAASAAALGLALATL